MVTGNIYEAFDLKWHSSKLTIDELPLSLKKEFFDIKIEEEDHNNWPDIPFGLFNTPFVQAIPGDLRLNVPEICFLRVLNGEKIAWERKNNHVQDNDITSFMLGSGFGSILIQKNNLVLHGNAMKKKDKVILCLGCSGAGKSTLAYALMKLGWQLMSDDLIAISSNLEVLPGIPRIKLWQDALNKFSINYSNFNQIRNGIFKYLIPYEEIHFNNSKSKIDSIYIINNHKEENLSIEKVNNQQECLLRIRNQLYRPRFVRSLGKENVSFTMINNLIKRTNIFKLTLPFGIKEMQFWLEKISL